ncbi:UNVERIFIED_CONTAM: F-box only protein 6 [Sesamum radiatum]|uniref:F-box only protein 6 n=1 Tax=Sesamum radiatum TaxID=300843 RepID=A0AAW2MX40_SESRA
MTAGKSKNLKMLEPGKPPPTKKARKERNQGKATVTTNLTENMEQHVWKEFPEDLFEAVIARLPIATFFRFRSWHQQGVSSAFLISATEASMSVTSDKIFRELPARSVKVWSRVAVGMTLNGKSSISGYKILWVGCEGNMKSTIPKTTLGLVQAACPRISSFHLH